MKSWSVGFRSFRFFRLSRLVSALVLSLATLAAGCGSFSPWARKTPRHDDNPPGTWHRVRSGETLLGIALDADVALQDLMEINGIDDANTLKEGQVIYVLGATAREQAGSSGGGAPSEEPASDGSDRDLRDHTLEPSYQGSAGSSAASPSVLGWPLDAPRISSPFGQRWGHPHEGIDFDAPTGTPVRAADAGEVMYAGDQIRGYGNMIVIQHGSRLVTVYAHNSVLLVQPGDKVTRGQMIARVGRSGRATGPHLHFEVRDREIPRDPAPYLPKRR